MSMSATSDALPSASRRLFVRAPSADVVVTAVTASVVAVLVLLPLVLLAWRSVTPGGELSLDAYRTAFAGVPLASVAWTTAVFAVGSTAVGLTLGGALAFALVRTDLPARRVLFVLAVAPLVLPGVLQTIAWIFLAAPGSGLLSSVPGMPSAFGLGGMVLVEGLRLVPIALLLVAAALRSGDPALEEAARVAGASRGAVLRRVTIPLLRPALAAAALLLVLRSIGSFEVPALLGMPERTWVFTSRVWLALGSSGNAQSDAAAASVPLLGLTLLGTLVLAAALRRPRAREAVTGRAHRHPPLPLGRWRLPALGAVLAYLAVAVALPVGALVWMSTQPFLARPSADAFGRASLDAYGRLFRDDVTTGALRNSVLYAALAALVATALATVVAWTALRARTRARHALDSLAFLPIAVPGLVLGVGLLQLFLRAPAALYATGTALVLGYVARYLPYATRFAGAGFARLGRDLEDAARVGGARWWPTLRRVTVPLAAAAVGAAWLAAFTVAFTDVSLSLVLTSPGNEVVGVRIWSLYESGRWDELAALGVVTVGAVAALGLVTVALGRLAARRARAVA
jgi:iron(III) transport system permease protein